MNEPRRSDESQEVEYKCVRRNIDDAVPKGRLLLPIFLSFFQIIFIVLFALFVSYEDYSDIDGHSLNMEYSTFTNINTMIFIGFGLTMTWLKRHGYGSIGYSFLLAAYSLQWSFLFKGFLAQTQNITFSNWIIKLNLKNLISADYCVASILISVGALIGRVNLFQLVLIATIEVIIQSFNEMIGQNYLMIHDAGKSLYTYMFGAFFGLSVSIVMDFKRIENEKENSTYNSNLTSMIGTLILWLYWPQLNAAVSHDQTLAALNTILSMLSSCTATFILSILVSKGKLNMIHIRNATLAGGVAISGVADLPIQPFGAILVGLFAGLVSTLCIQYVTTFLKHHCINDTCGVASHFGIPSLISGFLTVMAAFIFNENNLNADKFYKIYPARISTINATEVANLTSNFTEYNRGDMGRTALAQGGFQILAVAHTILIAVFFGIITGIIMKVVGYMERDYPGVLFEDEKFWICPENDVPELTQLNIHTEEQQELIQQKATIYKNR